MFGPVATPCWGASTPTLLLVCKGQRSDGRFVEVGPRVRISFAPAASHQRTSRQSHLFGRTSVEHAAEHGAGRLNKPLVEKSEIEGPGTYNEVPMSAAPPAPNSL